MSNSPHLPFGHGKGGRRRRRRQRNVSFAHFAHGKRGEGEKFPGKNDPVESHRNWRGRRRKRRKEATFGAGGGRSGKMEGSHVSREAAGRSAGPARLKCTR